MDRLDEAVRISELEESAVGGMAEDDSRPVDPDTLLAHEFFVAGTSESPAFLLQSLPDSSSMSLLRVIVHTVYSIFRFQNGFHLVSRERLLTVLESLRKLLLWTRFQEQLLAHLCTLRAVMSDDLKTRQQILSSIQLEICDFVLLTEEFNVHQHATSLFKWSA